MELTTDRLFIRSFRFDDTSDYAELARDPEVMRYLGEPLDAAAAAGYIADCVERDRSTAISRYAVLRKTDGVFLGFCGFKALDEDFGHQVPTGEPWLDFGWRYRREVWHQGIGTEAALAVYAFGKSELGLGSLEARAHCDNIGSLRIIEKLGFAWLNDYTTAIGTFRRYREPAG